MTDATTLMPDPPDAQEDTRDDFEREFDKQAKKDFLASETSPNHRRWRKEAEQDFDFVPGGAYDPDEEDGGSGQWHKDDVMRLKSDRRPIVTMNRTEPLVEGIVGAEVNNRQQVSFQPRETDDKDVADTLMEISQWARDNDVEEEETDAFRNALICGMGWLRHTMDYSEDLDGRYAVVSEDPLGHYWDVDARRPNLTDARWVGYVEKMSKDKARSLFGKRGFSDNIFGKSGSESESSEAPNAFNSDYDDPRLMDVAWAEAPDEIKIFEYQCYKMEPVWRVIDPNTNQIGPMLERQEFYGMRDAVEARGGKMVRQGTPVDPPTDEEMIPVTLEDGTIQLREPPVYRFLQQEHRVYYKAFYSGGKRLERIERNMWRNGFTRQCITGRRHRKRNTWYGVVRAMKDPQRLTNSFMSAMIFHWMSNPKGGVYYEEDAVDDPTEIEGKLANPSPAVKLRPNGLQKIQHISPAPASPALAQLMSIVSDMPPLVTGVSLEWLGLASRDQPVGLEQTRKLATLSIVAPIFSSYRKYKKNAGRLLFDYVKDYMPEGTLQRVVSAALRDVVPKVIEADTLKYDIHVDDAPLSPSVKATVFSNLKDMMQFGGKLLPPSVAMEVVKAFFRYSPLPGALVRDIEKALQPPPPDPAAMLMQLGEIKKIFAEAAAKEADADLKEAKADNEGLAPEMEMREQALKGLDQVMNLVQTQMQTQAKQAQGGAQ